MPPTTTALEGATPMTRSEIVEHLANQFPQLTQRDVEAALAAILNGMAVALVRGSRIEIRGFGSFTVSIHAPRKGRNPRTGESVPIPPRRVVHFKPGKALRTSVDQ